MSTHTEWDSGDGWGVVEQFLPAGWRDAARLTGALRRTREIPDAGVLLRVLLLHLSGCSLQETALRATQAGWCSISGVTVFNRLQSSEEWLRWLAQELWQRRIGAAPTLARRVRAVDATTLTKPGGVGTDWRVHFAIDLSTLRCDFFELTDVRGGETLRRIPIQPGDLILGDRAYGTPTGIAHATAAGGDVLVRCALHMLPLYTAAGARFAPLAAAARLKVGAAGQWPTWVQTAGRRIAGRLVAIKRGAVAARVERARRQRKARRQQRTFSARALEAAGYVFVWTTCDKRALSAAEALDLYRIRWQIELAFKRMKSLLELGHLRKWTDASARAWIHGKLFLALLLETLLDAAQTVSPWGYRLAATPQPLA